MGGAPPPLLRQLFPPPRYLIKLGRIPPDFFKLVYSIKYSIVPFIARSTQPDCVYEMGAPLGGGCSEGTRRSFYLLNPWMMKEMQVREG